MISEWVLFTLFAMNTQNLVKNCSHELLIFERVFSTSIKLIRWNLSWKLFLEDQKSFGNFVHIDHIKNQFLIFEWLCSFCSYGSRISLVKNCFRKLSYLKEFCSLYSRWFRRNGHKRFWYQNWFCLLCSQWTHKIWLKTVFFTSMKLIW